MHAVDIKHATIGTVSSRVDGSICFRVVTPELLPSQAGAMLGWHGKACRVAIFPDEGTPEEVITVEMEREGKTPGQRLRAVLFVAWKNEGDPASFEAYYAAQVEKYINLIKSKLP